MRMRVLAVLGLGAALAGVPAAASAQLPSDDGSARRPFGGPQQCRRGGKGMELLRAPATSRPDVRSSEPRPRSSFFELRHGLPGQLRVRRRLQRLPDLRHREPVGADAEDRGRLPRRPGRRVRLRQPAVHVGRGDAREEGLHADPGGRRDDALPRRPHLRHLEHRGAACRSGRSRPAAARTRTRWCVRRTTPINVYIYVSGHVAARSRPATELAGCDSTDPATSPNPSQWRIEVIKVPLAAPQTRPRSSTSRACSGRADGRRQRPAERAADAAAPVRHGLGDAKTALLGAGPGHELLPRHHGLRGARPGGRLLRGQRPADRHLRPGEPEAHRRRRRPAVRLLARRDVLQRRQERLLHRRVGRRHEPRAAARPTS